mmetsp:Transcript_3184/g.9042  ORF Transcript_3184/g.9042 Transcript_3184/m.9042 type:complete len:220 (+) Transcript_3184:234-893(+)
MPSIQFNPIRKCATPARHRVQVPANAIGAAAFQVLGLHLVRVHDRERHAPPQGRPQRTRHQRAPRAVPPARHVQGIRDAIHPNLREFATRVLRSLPDRAGRHPGRPVLRHLPAGIRRDPRCRIKKRPRGGRDRDHQVVPHQVLAGGLCQLLRKPGRRYRKPDGRDLEDPRRHQRHQHHPQLLRHAAQRAEHARHRQKTSLPGRRPPVPGRNRHARRRRR